MYLKTVKFLWQLGFLLLTFFNVSSLEPEWMAAATEVKEQTKGKVKLGAVDATVHQGLASRYEVRLMYITYLMSLNINNSYIVCSFMFDLCVPLSFSSGFWIHWLHVDLLSFLLVLIGSRISHHQDLSERRGARGLSRRTYPNWHYCSCHGPLLWQHPSSRNSRGERFLFYF